jgi:hypothetical protein
MSFKLCPPGRTTAPGTAAASAPLSFEPLDAALRHWTAEAGGGCLDAVVVGGDPADDAASLSTLASGLRWIERRRLDSTAANLTDGRVDTV